MGCDHGNAIKGRSHSDKGGLEMFWKPQHIKAIGCGVVRCRTESHQPEEGKCILEESARRDEERN